MKSLLTITMVRGAKGAAHAQTRICRCRYLPAGRDDAALDPASQHQAIAVGLQRQDRLVDPLEAGGRPHEVAVVEGQHDRAARLGIEDSCQAVLHAPIILVRAFEKKARHLLGSVDEIFFVLRFGLGAF